MFGRATIRLGIGPHSSICMFLCVRIKMMVMIIVHKTIYVTRITTVNYLNNCSAVLWSPYVIGQTIYIFILFLSSTFFFFPRLISAVGDWMSAILPHMVWP